MSRRLIQNARALRARMTDAEQFIWQALRAEQLGVKFRRQVPIGRHVVDFACLSHFVVIEIDGGQHADCADDVARDAFLDAEGFKVLRFWNNEVLQQRDAVLEVIGLALRERGVVKHRSPPPQPSPLKGEGVVRERG